jgi:hypothetical protein
MGGVKGRRRVGWGLRGRGRNHRGLAGGVAETASGRAQYIGLHGTCGAVTALTALGVRPVEGGL